MWLLHGTLCSQSLQAVSVEISVQCHLVYFLLVLYLFFLFFLILASTPNTFWFTLRSGGEERSSFPGCAAAWCLVPMFAVTAREQSLGDPSVPTLHTAGSQPKSPPQFLSTDRFLMLVWFFWFFFLLKMYPYTLHLNTLWNSPCEEQTDIMLCALQVVALLICCFPNNSRFFYFASVFVASCYLLAKTKQASLVSKAFHQLSHQHFASLVSFAFVLCLLHSH